MTFNYEIRCTNEDYEEFEIYNKKKGITYTLNRMADGSFNHTCKVITVRGPTYMCRHKKMVLKMFYAQKDKKYIFNISPDKKTKRVLRTD